MVDNSAAKVRLASIKEIIDRRNVSELDSLIYKSSMDLWSCLSSNILYIDDTLKRKLKEIRDQLTATSSGSIQDSFEKMKTSISAALADVATKATDKPALQNDLDKYTNRKNAIIARGTNYADLFSYAEKFKNSPLDDFDIDLSASLPRTTWTNKIDLDSKFVNVGTVNDYFLCDKDWNRLSFVDNPSWWRDYKINIWWQEYTLKRVEIIWVAGSKKLDCSNMEIDPSIPNLPQSINLSIDWEYNSVSWEINVVYNKKFKLKLNDWVPPLNTEALRRVSFENYNKWWVWWTSKIIENCLKTEIDEEQNWWKQKKQRDAIEKVLKRNWWTLYDTLTDSQKSQFLAEILKDTSIIDFSGIFWTPLVYSTFKNWFTSDKRAWNKDISVIKPWKYEAFIHNNLEQKVNEFISSVLDSNLQTKEIKIKWELTKFIDRIEKNKLDDDLNKKVWLGISGTSGKKLYEMEKWPRSPFHARDNNYMRFFSWSSTEVKNQKVNIYTKAWESEPVKYGLKMDISWKNNISVEIKIDWLKEPIRLSSWEPTALVRRILREQKIKYWKVRAHIWYNIYKAMIQLAKEKKFSLQYREKTWTRFIDLDWDNIIVKKIKNLTTENSEDDVLIFNQEKFENTNEFGWLLNNSLERWLLEIWKHFNYAMNQAHRQYRRWVERRLLWMINSRSRMKLPTSFWLSPIKKLLNMRNTTNFDFETSINSKGKIINVVFAKNKFIVDMDWLDKPLESRDLWKILNKRQNKSRIFDWMERDIVEWIYSAMIDSLRQNAKVANTDFWVIDEVTWNMLVLDKDWRFWMVPKEDLDTKTWPGTPMTWTREKKIFGMTIKWSRNRKKFWTLNHGRLDKTSLTWFERGSLEEKELLRNPLLMQRLIRAMNRRMWLFESLRSMIYN